GTATETLIRCLGDLKEDGLIEINRRKIIILDVKGLKEVRY
ncbi:MAG: winged helix-turn-helix domain-containing protein, partial [Halobacteriovoraceae bacterium]|nr:winged helix-turn-helix domain-containing protein [Halobacteriovoraceae bacterium]